jgi:gliding motility-associated-like protein
MVVAAFAASDTMPSIGSQVNFTNNSTGAISYYWTFGDNTGTSDLINPNYTYSAPGEYPVWLYAYSQNSCIDSTTVNIHINFAGYAIPSAFSPNNDGLNDVLFVRGGPFVEYEMRIFNSWGQQIFISNSQTIGWDGTYKGKDAQEGVYVLIFKGKIADGTEINYSGDITLVR